MEGEDQRAQDERVERLWQDLDTQGEGKLSLQGLRRGLRKMDHRELWADCWEVICANTIIALKNADSLLEDVMKAVDTNGDGDIQYSGM